MADSDCIVIMGANMAENHPVGFRFVLQAKERGATVIHIDPRFSRTSALADMHVPLRAGSDLIFLGALVNYVLHSARWHDDPFFREYVTHYTNASVLISPDFKDTEDLGGLFGGYNAEERRYDSTSWQYAGNEGEQGQPQAGHEQDSEARTQIVGQHGGPEQRLGHGDKPQLRVSTGQAPLRPLHPRTGRAVVWCAASAVYHRGRGAACQLGARAH
jgi:formate dehydrogenase major subunit